MAYTEDRFTPAQCEGGIIMAILGNAKAGELMSRYIADAMEFMSEADFIAMNARIAEKTS